MPEKDDQEISLTDSMKILHENCRQNIEACKNRQWQVAYYGLLTLGALVVSNRMLHNEIDSLVRTVVSVLLVLGAAGGAGLVLDRLQRSQRHERRTLVKVQEYFPQQYRDLSGAICTSYWYHGGVLALLYAVLFIGAAVSILLTWPLGIKCIPGAG
ncbi:MAG: hypothetical protein WEB85_11230 [Dongiaceae bacterium]